MIVTIDGPAGTGKSTAARALAERLGFEYLDTGAMYRAVAILCVEDGIDLESDAAAARAQARPITFVDGRTLVGDRDVTDLLRTPEASRAASLAARHPGVRAALVEQQRVIAAGRNIVCEGRDQGTVAFPRAGCKFFLTASPEERARRRQQQLERAGQAVPFEELLRQQRERDERDASRSVAPLRPADDAITLDTTRLTSGDVLDQLEAHVRRRMD
ncbi:MAG: (d)CMP kinase [Planctomyces sp.]|nr:(d)CMP kinase [Planctomyces sp.]